MEPCVAKCGNTKCGPPWRQLSRGVMLRVLFQATHSRTWTSWAVVPVGSPLSWRGWQALGCYLCTWRRLAWQTPRLEQVYRRPRGVGIVVTTMGIQYPLFFLLVVGGGWVEAPQRLLGSPFTRRGFISSHLMYLYFSLSCIGEGNGNPLQCSCLENPRDGGAWWAAVCGVTQSRTRLKWLSAVAMYLCLGRSSGKGNGNPLQYSRLENPTGRGAWWATVHGVYSPKGWTRQSAQTICGNTPVRLFSLGLFSGFSVVFISRSGEVAEELCSSTVPVFFFFFFSFFLSSGLQWRRSQAAMDLLR